MRVFFLLLAALTASVPSLAQHLHEPAATPLEWDQFGRVTLNSKGERIIYSFDETPANSRLDDSPSNLAEEEQQTREIQFSNVIECDTDWEYTIMGTSIGRRSLNVVDLNNDGITEIICSAQPDGFYDSDQSYWYVLKYKVEKDDYVFDWISPMYDDHIRRMTVADFAGDGSLKIIAGFVSGKVHVYDGLTKNLVHQFVIPSGLKVNDIQFGDADNDGQKEIAISDGNNIYFYDTDFSLKGSIPYGCFDFKIGNVDEDDLLELVTSNGYVLLYDGQQAEVKWRYHTDFYGELVELADINNDGINDIVWSRGWYQIKGFDAVEKTEIFSHAPQLNVNALYLFDTNNDGTVEILYGDGQHGYVHCLQAGTLETLWQITNPDHGVTAIAIADVNNNGSYNLIWGGGWTSTGPDHLFIADIPGQYIEWRSPPLKGPFYAIATGDIDNDGVDNIVAMAHKGIGQYIFGVMLVFNTQTYTLDWLSPTSLFHDTFSGYYDIELYDIDNDDVMEIIVAGGWANRGRIHILDGITKEIKGTHLYGDEGINEFYSLTAGDFNLDGQAELAVTSRQHIYFINPVDFSISWTADMVPQIEYPAVIMHGNIDDDTQDKIVACRGHIYVIDGLSQQMWTSPHNHYTNIDLFDYTGNGKLEIVAGTNTGMIVVIDGSSFNIIHSFSVLHHQINGLRVADLNGNGVAEYIVAADGRVYYYAVDSLILMTNKLAEVAGKYNALKVIETDKGKEVIVGTSTRLAKLMADCYTCLWFHSTSTLQHASCIADDGFVIMETDGGVEPYEYQWSTGETSHAIHNLSPGTYHVTIRDGIGCEWVETFVIRRSELLTSHTHINVGCNQTDTGQASVHILEGTAPFHFQWNSGHTGSSASGLAAGTYEVIISDARGCVSYETIEIAKEKLVAGIEKTDIRCYGIHDGSAIANIVEGMPPFSYAWSNGESSPSLHDLGPGQYSVSISDSRGCLQARQFEIIQPDAITAHITITPDDQATPQGEGSATIEVSGGVPPYTIYWYGPPYHTGHTFTNLSAGTYYVSLADANMCEWNADVVITTVEEAIGALGYADILLYPNPAIDHIYLQIDLEWPLDVSLEIHDSWGRKLFSDQLSFIGSIPQRIGLYGFSTGVYHFTVIIQGRRFVFPVAIMNI